MGPCGQFREPWGSTTIPGEQPLGYSGATRKRDIVATISIRDVRESVRDSLLFRARVRGQTLEQFLREFLISSFSKKRALQSIDFRRARLPRVNVQDLLHRDDEGRYE